MLPPPSPSPSPPPQLVQFLLFLALDTALSADQGSECLHVETFAEI